jgi:hypothetical protein
MEERDDSVTIRAGEQISLETRYAAIRSSALLSGASSASCDAPGSRATSMPHFAKRARYTSTLDMLHWFSVPAMKRVEQRKSSGSTCGQLGRAAYAARTTTRSARRTNSASKGVSFGSMPKCWMLRRRMSTVRAKPFGDCSATVSARRT